MEDHPNSVTAVYDLREAAVEHGKAVAAAEATVAPAARDRLLRTTIELEKKTSAALDECAKNAEEAVKHAEETDR